MTRREQAEAALRAAEAATRGSSESSVGCQPGRDDGAAPGAQQAGPGAPVGPASSASAGASTGDDPVGEALAFVLRSTRQRPQTEAEVARKLARREHGEDVIDAALARARDLGAVDDAAFARAWVEDRGRGRGYGTARLREELRRKGVTDADIDAALLALADRDEHSTAVDLARRRLARLPAGLDAAAVLRRLTGYLVRRGYPPGLAERAAREAAHLADHWD